MDLKKARIKAGLTQKQLSQLTGIHQNVISRIESGATNRMQYKTYLSLVKIIDLNFEQWKNSKK